MPTEEEWIRQLPEAKGDQKREVLLKLCDFRSETADAFWGERLRRPLTQYLPYLCYSRCDAAADFAAGQLEHVVNKMIILRNQFNAELSEEAWYALNLSAFKESSRMLEVLDKIGRHYEQIFMMELDVPALIHSHTIPPFLRRMANLVYAHGGNFNFIRLVNDLLICTLVRSEGAFHDSISRLAEQYPQAYGYAGFFAEFVRNSSAAYEQYAYAERLEQILFTFTGLDVDQKQGLYEQYTPLWFFGVRNRIWLRKYTLPCPDLRWITFLSRTYVFAEEAQLRKISELLFRFTELASPYREQLQEYFFQTALTDTTETNLIGFMRCGGYERADELIQGICEKICEGKNNYHALFTVFDLLDLKKPEKLRLLGEARAYIESTDNRESWYAQRNRFLHAVRLYEDGRTIRFE